MQTVYKSYNTEFLNKYENIERIYKIQIVNVDKRLYNDRKKLTWNYYVIKLWKLLSRENYYLVKIPDIQTSLIPL